MDGSTEKRDRRGRKPVYGEKQHRTQINLPPGLRRIADAACAQYGITLSDFYRQATTLFALSDEDARRRARELTAQCGDAAGAHSGAHKGGS